MSQTNVQTPAPQPSSPSSSPASNERPFQGERERKFVIKLVHPIPT